MNIPTYQIDTKLGYTRYGWMLYLAHDKYVGGSIAEYGEYSPAETLLLRSLLEPGDVAVDVGANLGAMTLAFADAVGPTGAVVAYEPQPVVAKLLRANATMNQLANVTVIAAGAGRDRTTFTIPLLNYNNDANYGAASLSELESLAAASKLLETIPVVTLDESLPADLAAKVKLLKVDVEGMEEDVLRGAVATIVAAQPWLFVECDRPDTAPQLLRYITSLGYTPYWVINYLYDPYNLYNSPTNLWPNQASFNVLCVPPGRQLPVPGLRVASPDDPGIPNNLVANGVPVLSFTATATN